MKKFNEEISHWNEYDYVLVNDDLEDCYNEILKIMNVAKTGKKLIKITKVLKKK